MWKQAILSRHPKKSLFCSIFPTRRVIHVAFFFFGGVAFRRHLDKIHQAVIMDEFGRPVRSRFKPVEKSHVEISSKAPSFRRGEKLISKKVVNRGWHKCYRIAVG